MDKNTLSPCTASALSGTRQLTVAGKQVGIHRPRCGLLQKSRYAGWSPIRRSVKNSCAGSGRIITSRRPLRTSTPLAVLAEYKRLQKPDIIKKEAS